MEEIKLPLYIFFQELRKREQLELGVDDYEALLIALQSDLSYVNSKSQLMLLCKALWLKPGHNLVTFESLFTTYFSHLSKEVEEINPSETAITEQNQPNLNTETPIEKSPAPIAAETADPQNKTEEEVKEELEEEVFNGQPDLGDIYLNIRKHNTEKPANTGTERKLTERYDFLFWDEFLPYPRRQIEQQWRFLKKDVWEKDNNTLDINATVEALARHPMVFRPHYFAKKVNTAELVMLIDHSKNMAAFNRLADVVAETAIEAGGIDLHLYYFKRLPQQVLYRDKANTVYESLNQFVQKFKKKHTSLLILSDGGAARNELSIEWVSEMENFLKEIDHTFSNIVWLNPIPEDRWEGTNVELIQYSVPVCPMTPQGFRQTVQLLRGRKITY